MSLAEDAVVEMVFVAGTPAELDRAADVLTSAEMDFETKPQAFRKPFLGGSVYEGIGFFVLAGQAAFARGELRRNGLDRGVVTGEPTELATVREDPLA